MNLEETTIGVELAISIQHKADIGGLAKMMPESLHDWQQADLDFLSSIIRSVREVRAQSKKAQFRIGQRVTFNDNRKRNYGPTQCIGTITKINSKTINVTTDQGIRWKVYPQHLSPYNPAPKELLVAITSDREEQSIVTSDVVELEDSEFESQE